MLKEPYLSEADDFGFSIDPSTNMGFMTSNRKGGMGGDDNYYFQIKPKLDGLIDTYFFETDTLNISDEGVLKNDQDLIKLEDPLQQLFTKEVIINETTKEGNLELNPNGSFKYIITNPLMAKDSFSYKIVSDSYSSKPISVYLNRKKDILSDEQITSYKLEPIFYKFDKFDLWNIYKDRFDKVIELLNQNPSFKLRISSYADARGSDSYNMELSEERAISIFNFIKSQIVNNNFIELKSFGERAIKNNSYKNYILIGGVFKNSVNANSIIKKIEKIGYSPIMIIDEKGFHKVVIDSFDYNFQAKKAKQELFKKNIESWIDKSPPIKEDESVHQKNRRVEFDIIK
jgi:outer membrane protein OmpA-like peptidoglycan-associated protein